MRPSSWDCPYCGFEQEFLLIQDQPQHLRQCTTCDHWFIIDEQSDQAGESGANIERLGDPPACPVDGCEEVSSSDSLVPHLIEQHGGSLTSNRC